MAYQNFHPYHSFEEVLLSCVAARNHPNALLRRGVWVRMAFQLPINNCHVEFEFSTKFSMFLRITVRFPHNLPIQDVVPLLLLASRHVEDFHPRFAAEFPEFKIIIIRRVQSDYQPGYQSYVMTRLMYNRYDANYTRIYEGRPNWSIRYEGSSETWYTIERA